MTPEAADSLAAGLLGLSRTELGGLQINHARRVAARVRITADNRVIAAALLHAVVSTHCITADELRAVVADERVAEIVEVLTRTDGEADEPYLARCAANPFALMIKRADLADSLIAIEPSVAAAVALRIRRQASRRLALLNLLARRHDR
jgi:(p)ppGpp synthase/HD superfamily hydrolase